MFIYCIQLVCLMIWRHIWGIPLDFWLRSRTTFWKSSLTNVKRVANLHGSLSNPRPKGAPFHLDLSEELGPTSFSRAETCYEFLSLQTGLYGFSSFRILGQIGMSWRHEVNREIQVLYMLFWNQGQIQWRPSTTSTEIKK